MSRTTTQRSPLDEHPSLCLALISSQRTEPLNLVQSSSPSAFILAGNLLSHYIPSSRLDLEDEVFRWSEVSTCSTYSTLSKALTISNLSRHDLHHACYASVEWTRDKSSPQIIDRTMESCDEQDNTAEALLPLPLRPNQTKRAVSPVPCILSPKLVDTQIEGHSGAEDLPRVKPNTKSRHHSRRNCVNLEDFHFDFGYTPSSTPKDAAIQAHHSSIPSLSYSSSSSPPATPPPQYYQLLLPAIQNPQQCTTDSQSKTLGTCCSPRILSQPRMSPSLFHSTYSQSSCSVDDNSRGTEYLAHRPAPAIPSATVTVKKASPNETSFMEWDDSTSRLTRMKKSFNDLRRPNNSTSTLQKRRKNVLPQLHISKPSLASRRAFSNSTMISLPVSTSLEDTAQPMLTPLTPSLPSPVTDDGSYMSSQPLSPNDTTVSGRRSRLSKVKGLWEKVASSKRDDL